MKFQAVVMVFFVALVSQAQERVEVSFQLIGGWAIVLDGNLGGCTTRRC